jgi:hypothetical protein
MVAFRRRGRRKKFSPGASIRDKSPSSLDFHSARYVAEFGLLEL